jgi:hypothetical protein
VQPMFLIAGQAFIMKLSYGGKSTSEPMFLVFDKKLTGEPTQGVDLLQGMRIVHDVAANAIAISVSCNKHGMAPNFEFGMVQTTLDGDLKWARMFPANHNMNGIALPGDASHPYALTGAPDGSGYVIGGLAVVNGGGSYGKGRFAGYTQGRLVKVSPKGELVFDQRFQSRQPNTNVECYGISSTGAGDGYILSCGTGVEPELYPNEPEQMRTWMALVHRTDLDGKELWQRNYSSNRGPPYRNNAGEHIITTKEGGYAVFLDSQSCGNPNTGGNFALLLLDKDNTSGTARSSLPSETDDVVEGSTGSSSSSAAVRVGSGGNASRTAEDVSSEGDAWRQKMWARRRARHVSWLRSASASRGLTSHSSSWLSFKH